MYRNRQDTITVQSQQTVTKSISKKGIRKPPVDGLAVKTENTSLMGNVSTALNFAKPVINKIVSV